MKNIGVFFGSRSTEHDISIITGEFIISGLKKLGYEATPIYINREGEWMIGGGLDKLSVFIDPETERKTLADEGYKSYFIDLKSSRGKIVFRKKGVFGKKITIDLAFPAFHGAYGEDGTIQGLFEMLDVPYVGCNVPSSAISMDKAFTKQICSSDGIPVVKSVAFNDSEWNSEKDKIIKKIGELKYPLFVKPVHGGSSIGISKVKEADNDLHDKIEVALHYDNKVIVEEGVPNLMDVTCCIIGNDELHASLLQEAIFQADLFDFEEKYLKDGGSQLGKSESGIVIPARVSDEKKKEIQDMAKAAYRAIGCSGIARIDFLLNKESGELFMNEINPLPGTLYHHLWQEEGIKFEELLTKLIGFAEERYQNKKKIFYGFKSSVLTSLNSTKFKSSKLGKL